jgi:SAM-dependent methyltransferase
MRINRCRICKSKNLATLFSLGNLSFTGKFSSLGKTIKKKPITLIICKSCSLVQLAHNYDLKYLYGPDYGYRTGINKTMLSHVRKITKVLANKTHLKKKDLVLDIASNDGSLLNFYSKGVIKCGIDPILNKYKKNYKKIKYAIPSFFSANLIRKKTKKKFKIITALSVFYDAEDPNKFLKDVSDLLAPNGVFLLEFADLASILKFKMFDTICHEHLEYYSTQVIIKLASENGLKVFDIKENKINGGSKQYFICLKHAKIPTNNMIINKILKAEYKLKLDKVATFKDFFKNINNLKKRLNKILVSIKNNNQKIHCYGASTKGNVLLQYYKINNRMINFVAERNKNKYGLFTPGTKIKIISEKSSRSLKPNYYLVLPWHFKDEILKREKKTIKQGIKFIFPLPNIKIVS